METILRDRAIVATGWRQAESSQVTTVDHGATTPLPERLQSLCHDLMLEQQAS